MQPRYREPDPADPILDPETILRLIRLHVPSAKTVSAVDESGGEARAYLIDSDLVFKVQRPHRVRPRTNQEKEVFYLDQLAAADPDLPVPRVRGYGRENGIEYTCMTRVPGVPALAVDLEETAKAALLAELGRTLRRVHSVPQEPFLTSPLFPGPRSREEFVEQTTSSFNRAVGVFKAEPERWPFTTSPASVAAAARARLPSQVDLVALHSNPGPEHTYIDPVTHQFTGLIDFGDAYIGHPASDCRWRTHEDSLLILKAYCQDMEEPDEFVAAWRSLRILNAMSSAAGLGFGRGAQALGSLDRLIAELG